jgi:hypothetical protein
VIDGVLQPDEWAGALRVTDFRDIAAARKGRPGPDGLRTEAWIGRTASSLCVAFRCFHDRPSEILTVVRRHDGPVWADDSVEVFLDALMTRHNYYHVVVNSAGAVYDAYNSSPGQGDASWDSGTTAAAQLTGDGFIVEMAIPFSALNLGLNTKGEIALNLCRNARYCVGNYAAFGGYHEPATWRAFPLPDTGPARFPVAVERAKWSLFSGENETSVTLRNLTEKPIRLTGRLLAAQGGRRQEVPLRVTLAADGDGELRAPCVLADKGEAALHLTFRDPAKREIVSLHRYLQPKAPAAVSVDSDVLFRGERPCLTATLNVGGAPTDYQVQAVVRAHDGTEILRREIPVAKPELRAELDLSQLPLTADRVGIEVIVAHRQTGKEIFRSNIPLSILPAPW